MDDRKSPACNRGDHEPCQQYNNRQDVSSCGCDCHHNTPAKVYKD